MKTENDASAIQNHMYFEQYLFWTVSKQMRSQGCPKGFLVVVQGV